MAEQSRPTTHLSIGEVLALVHDEFPDVTISKIRFLESQGLIDPERTPSGYRKFYEEDVELLRCILREQRENYLPLRVIKDRLNSGEIDPTNEQPRPAGIKNVTVAGDEGADAGAGAESSDQVADATADQLPGLGGPDPAVDSADDRPSSSVRGDHPSAGSSAHAGSTAASFFAPANTQVANGTDSAEAGRLDQTGDRPVDHPGARGGADPTLPVPPGGLEAGEICALTGLTADQLDGLVSFGVVVSTDGGGARFDDRALEIATIAKRLLDAGLDARHLRGWRVAVDRMAGLYEQLIQPLLRQRNPEAQQQAIVNLKNLDHLGGELYAALMRDALHLHLDE